MTPMRSVPKQTKPVTLSLQTQTAIRELQAQLIGAAQSPNAELRNEFWKMLDDFTRAHWKEFWQRHTGEA